VEVLTAEQASAGALSPARRRTVTLSGVGRVWLLSAGMVVAALALYLGTVIHVDPLVAPFHLPWWALAILFFTTETNVIRLRYRGQAQSFPLNELPLVLGLFFSNPPELLLGLLLGSAAAAIRRRRQSPLQLAFNTSHFFLSGVVASFAFFHVVAVEPLGPLGWSGALLATVIVTLLGHAAITAATLLSGTQPQVNRLSQVLSLGLASSVTTTMVALVAVDMLWRDQRSVLLLGVPLAMGYLTYRGYMEDHDRGDALDVIYESTRMLHRSPEVDAAVVGLLTQARGMFRAERAEITLFPSDADSPAVRTGLGPGAVVEAMVPIALDPEERAWAEGLPSGNGVLYPDEGGGLMSSLAERGIREAMVVVIRRDARVVGTILVGNRVGDFDHFDHSDLELFEPLARNLGLVLESGTLEQSLQQLRDLEAQLRHQAYHDPLTALANRSQFIERIEMALEFSAGDPRRMAVLFVDLDDFKVVNDSLGLPAGDQVLIAAAGRIKHVLGPADAAARLGADEFGVLLDCPEPGFAETVAESLLESLRRPLVVEGKELQVRASVGIAMGDSGRFADELLRNADVAMYTAKAAGKNRVQVFSADMHVAVIERHELIADLQRAIERDEFLLHYQPIVELASGRIVALEALVRWRHPRRGMVSPTDFIPVAEETGLILPIGRLILQKACAQARIWQEKYPEHADLSMGVNLSARQLQQVSFVGDTIQLIAESGVTARTLILEITETVLMDDTESHVAKLGQLKSLGLRLAMDDFGTGYSSLSFLSQLPIDILKIAKPFVEGLGRSEKDQAFAAAIVRLGQTVGMSLIAEGVERPDQLEELRRLGCDMVQGHHFATAGDAEAIDELLRFGLGARGGKVIPFPA
jgi:diguanylate cyclase (GGDEF)-like protein